MYVNPYFVNSVPNQEEVGESLETEMEGNWDVRCDKIVLGLPDIHVESNVNGIFNFPDVTVKPNFHIPTEVVSYKESNPDKVVINLIKLLSHVQDDKLLQSF